MATPAVTPSGLIELGRQKFVRYFDEARRFEGVIPPADGLWKSEGNITAGTIQTLIVRRGAERVEVKYYPQDALYVLGIWFFRQPTAELGLSLLLCRGDQGYIWAHTTGTGADVPLNQLPPELLEDVARLLCTI